MDKGKGIVVEEASPPLRFEPNDFVAFSRGFVTQSLAHLGRFEINVPLSLKRLDPHFLPGLLGKLASKQRIHTCVFRKGMNPMKASDPYICVSEDECVCLLSFAHLCFFVQLALMS